MNFDTAFDRLLGNEGGYVNNPADPGGETNWGVTVAVARASGYTGAMRDMTRARPKQSTARATGRRFVATRCRRPSPSRSSTRR